MTKIRIYQNCILKTNEETLLNKRNSHYLTKVLRIKDNAEIIIFNGDGFNYFAQIVKVDNQIFAKITNKIKNYVESNLNITLIQAIGKGEKMDFVIQKAVELGVNKIIPITTTRTIYKTSKKNEKKVMRWQEVAINSCEQSGRSFVPKVEEIIKFENLALSGDVFILDTTTDKKIKQYKKPENINIIIGPEGGFTDEELNNNYNKLSLGKRILRTETAGIVAIASFLALWEE
jgi:16S rRNA (uracil1498-N3)-methyltransferase